LKKKLVFLGDTNSINVELICKSHKIIKNKVKYIIIGNKLDLKNDVERLSIDININEINDPINFLDYDKNCLNVFNVPNISNKKSINLLNQIKISNFLANNTKYDLITMPINKSIFKKNMEFIGMTEYFAKINNKKTQMLMCGDKFSVIPFTTHINLKEIHRHLNSNQLTLFINNLLNNIQRDTYKLNFNEIKFLCYNPHCGENNTMGDEDMILKKTISKFNEISGIYPGDSAFINAKTGTLFISVYHDQGLIPFKILNKKSLNFTLGLDFRRLSPAHGTAEDIKFQNVADNSSYIRCMEY